MPSAIAERIAAAIHVDEIGLEFGRHGEVVLKTAYQPVFGPVGDALELRAFKGLTRPSRGGQRLPAAHYFEGLAPDARWQVGAMCAALQIRNMVQVDHVDTQLFIGLGGGLPTASCIDFLAEEADRAGLARGRLAVEIDEAAARAACWPAFSDAMRQAGFAIAIAGFGTGADADAVLGLGPDLVRPDDGFLRRAARSAAAIELLRLLVERLRDRGIKTVFGGIETEVELEAAIEARADFLRGYLLAQPAVAGALFEAAPPFPRPPERIASNVIRFG